jgi:hypothetical protein
MKTFSKHALNEFRIQALPADLIATRDSIKNLKIREGDEMFFMGLFTPFYRSSANVPVVRFGRLSMLTDEKISVVSGRKRVFLGMGVAERLLKRA